MAFETRFDEAKLAELLDGMVALATSPLVLLAAAAIEQPFVQTAIQEGVIFSERLKETAAETGEVFEDLVAEAKAQLSHEGRSLGDRAWHQSEHSEVAHTLSVVLSSLNQEIGRATNGNFDLRVLVPLAFSAFALRQLLVKGWQIDEIPWYTMAWYAFDSFVKLHPHPPGEHGSTAPGQSPPQRINDSLG
jgi:hypothetical protein